MVRRDGAAVAMAIVLLLTMIPLAGDQATGAEGRTLDGILFSEVSPKGDSEGFALTNYGSSAVDIGGYTIAKAYGDLSSSNPFVVNSGTTIDPGDTLAFVRTDSATDWFCRTSDTRDVVTMTSSGSRDLAVTDSAGTLYLYNASGTLIDTVAYRASLTGADNANPQAGWSGQSAYLGNKLQGIIRVESTDTDTAADWTPQGSGLLSQSYDSVTSVNTTVTPFTFPESSGKPIYDALAGATDWVCISIYMLTSQNIISILCGLEAKEVEVTLILEENPLGYDHPVEDLKALSDAGAEIWMIGGGTDDRYSYVHNKYMVVDGDTTVITSENWTSGNMECKDRPKSGNRGWGAAIYGADFANKMMEYFNNDVNYKDDLLSFTDAYPTATASTDLPTYDDAVAYGQSINYQSQAYNANVSIYMSPDNTYKALTELIDGAQERVYSQQMDLGAAWASLSVSGSPLTAMADAAYRGVDARFLLADGDEKTLIDELNSQSNVKAAIQKSSGFATMHNKGVVVDDTVWVSSVNWTPNSFYNNRECGLVIQSSQVADWYAERFLEDWNGSYTLKDTLTLSPGTGVPADGEEMTITAEGATGACTWTISRESGTTTESTDGNSLTLTNYEDLNYIRVTDSVGVEGRFVLTYAPAPEDTGGSDTGGSDTGGSDTGGSDTGGSDTGESGADGTRSFEIPEAISDNLLYIIGTIIVAILVAAGVLKR